MKLTKNAVIYLFLLTVAVNLVMDWANFENSVVLNVLSIVLIVLTLIGLLMNRKQFKSIVFILYSLVALLYLGNNIYLITNLIKQ
ncbi:hypothetical protein L1765_13135 [Microaerobacter geothermalis]|uniref:hypothetical protein n=1 Tax=Microaerobacter geothermalis TaxID=674972 RepID=UPI001F425262|nr:hypothetical protein [Microaerobacter geothermalis]MCF6094905.1 hypothetical protein [Microaerobacter geothermalis]